MIHPMLTHMDLVASELSMRYTFAFRLSITLRISSFSCSDRVVLVNRIPYSKSTWPLKSRASLGNVWNM
jgi:hypothetical protein